MKRKLLLFGLLTLNLNAFASHYLGGEITWKALGGSTYEFTVVLYRECRDGNSPSAGFNTSIQLSSNAGVSPILNRISFEDVSPKCNSSNFASGINLSCSTGLPNQGRVERHVYRNSNVQLVGTPPPTGWWFWYYGFARPYTLTNAPGSFGYTIRAAMFPYSINGVSQNVNTAYDSSPQFLEPPVSVLSPGYVYNYAHYAGDSDLDSISYSWAPPITDNFNPSTGFGNSLTYVNPYSFSNPLPSAPSTPLNLNPVTGVITFEPSIIGGFFTCVRVDEWRCGQLIGSVFRDIPIFFIPGVNTASGIPNKPPKLVIEFPPGYPSGQPILNSIGDTIGYQMNVFAGQSIKANISSFDVDLAPNFFLDSIIFNPISSQISTSNSISSGCNNPPCAVVSPSNGQSTFRTVLQNYAELNWQTDCNHVGYINTPCGIPTSSYVFAIRVQDKFCPAPAISNQSLIVNVISTIPVPPDMSNACVSINTSGGIDLSWGYPVDTGMNFDAYVIYHSTNPTAPFAVLDTVFNYNQLSYTHNAPGTGAHYYYIRTKGGCGYISVPTDTLQTIQMALTSLPPTNSYVADLAWNPSSSSYTQGYEVWRRQLPTGAWGMIATTNSLTYRDTVNVCGQNLEYQIRTVSGCSSTKESDFFSDQVNTDQLIIDSVTTQNGEVFMAWTPGSSNDIVDYYVLRRDAAGSWVPIDTLKPGTTMPYKIKGSVETVKDFYKVVSADSCGNISSDLLVRAANNMVLTENMDPCEGVMRLRWNTYKGWGAVKNYQIWMEETPSGGATVVSLIGTVGPNDSTFNQRNLNGGTTYCYYIKAVDTSETLYSSSNRICINSLAVQRSRLLYLAKASVREDRAVELVCFIDKDADIVDFDVQRADELGGPFKSLGRLPKPITGPWEFRYKDFTANPDDHRYVYRIVATDSCGNIDTASNIGRTMVLEVEENDNLTNFLTWNHYHDYMGGVDRYEIYRAVMPNGGYQLMGSTADTFFLDNTRPLGDYSGLVQYRVVAVEGPNPLVFRDADGSIFRSTSSVAVAEFAPRVFIPNSFNPKSDEAANRVWKPAQAYVSPGSYSLEIFDRWGQLVFETKNENKAWDGRMNGEFAPSGVYTYQLRYRSIEGEVVERRGTLNLLY